MKCWFRLVGFDLSSFFDRFRVEVFDRSKIAASLRAIHEIAAPKAAYSQRTKQTDLKMHTPFTATFRVLIGSHRARLKLRSTEIQRAPLFESVPPAASPMALRGAIATSVAFRLALKRSKALRISMLRLKSDLNIEKDAIIISTAEA